MVDLPTPKTEPKEEPVTPVEQQAPEPPSLDVWRDLYSLAQEFKELAPWEWISENALFVVVDPVTQEKCYCIIMGEVGEHLSIAIYLGDDGLNSLIDIREEVLQDPFELYFNQKCISLSFEDRELVTKDDREVYKALGLKFRGRKQYPLFRFHEPGFEPWHLDADQAAFVGRIFPEIKNIISQAQGDEEYFFLEDGRVRCFTPVPDGDGWRLEETAMEVVAPAREVSVPVLNELEVRRFIKECGKGAATLELDYFYFPGKIMEGPKPHHPQIVMVVSSDGPVVCFEFVGQAGGLYKTVQEQLCTALERIGQVPEAVLVQREDLAHVLEHYAPLFGFEVHLMEQLDALEDAKDGLFAAMGGFA